MTAKQLEACPLTGLSLCEMESAVEEIDRLTARMRPTELRAALRCRRARLLVRIRDARQAAGYGCTANGMTCVAEGE